MEWLLDYGFQRLVVSLHFNCRHVEYVFMEYGITNCDSKHPFFNFGAVLLACGEGSGNISNGRIVLYEDCSQPLRIGIYIQITL